MARANITTLPLGPHTLRVNTKGNQYEVAIDDTPFHTYKHSATSAWFGVEEDFPMEIDGVPYVLVVRKRTMRMASGGVYLDNGEPFVPAKPMPKWIWVFFALIILIPIVSLGGALNILLALGGLTLCALIARSDIKSGAAKVILCVVVTLTAWVVWFMLIGGLALLRML